MWKAIGWLLVFLFPIVMVYLTGGPSTEPLLDDHEYVRRKRIADAKKKKNKEETEEQTPTKKSKKNKKKKSSVVAPPETAVKTTTTTTTAAATAATTAKAKAAAAAAVEVKPTESTKSDSKKNKNKNKAETQPVVETKRAVKKQQEPKKQQQQQQTVKTPVDEEPVVVPSKEAVTKETTAAKNEEVETPVKEIDEHMDPTAEYARVLRIRPEEIEDEWESVPYEEGWSQVKTRRPAATSGKSTSTIDLNAEINRGISNSPLDKKQRENMARAQKKKEAKLAADKLQEERLRKHKKQLEKAKIDEFYSTGKGKNTPWGKNAGSSSRSKTPQSVASINEFGQLIWE